MKRRKFIASGSLLTAGLVWGRAFGKIGGQHDEAELYAGFKDPSMAYRPFVRWWWNGDKIAKAELARELRLLRDAGIGGVEINPIRFPGFTNDMGIPAVPWLSEAWAELIDFTLTEAAKLGMTCDLIAGTGWPFGAEWLEGDERSEMMTIATRKLRGPGDYEVSVFELLKDADPVLASPNDGRTAELVSVQMVSSPMGGLDDATDLTGTITAGILQVKVPPGNHTLYALVKMTGAMRVIYGLPGGGGPVLNHYNAAAIKKYLDKISAAITAKTGPLRGRLRAFFCDSLELEGANWCSDMAAEFERRRGYGLMPWLPYILFKTGYMGDTTDPGYGTSFSPDFNDEIESVRYDFELTKAELFKERFIDTFTGWCRENGVLSRMQAYGRGYMPLEGSFYADIPECETWIKYGIGKALSDEDYRQGRAYTVVNKYVSSAAHLLGKREISCEELTNSEMVFFESLETLKIAGDQSMISGVTHPIFHGFNYSPPEAPFPGWVRYGCYLNERNPWWPWFKRFTDYKARLSFLLRQGDMFADIALLSATPDLWRRFGAQNDPFPQNAWPAYQPMIWEAVHRNGSGCDYVSEGVIQRSITTSGEMRYGKRAYKTIFLIAVESMQAETAAKLLEFVQGGGRVFCIEKLPVRSAGRTGQALDDAAKMKALADRVTLLAAPTGDITAWYGRVQNEHGLNPYVRIDAPNSIVSQVRYTCGGAEALFFINSDGSGSHAIQINPSADISKGRHAWLWDPESGERYRLEDSASLRIDLGPAASKLVVFERDKRGNAYRPVPPAGAAIPLRWRLEGGHIDGSTRHAELQELQDLVSLPEWTSFCGTLIYRAHLTVAERHPYKYADLGKVYGVSTLRINGQSAGSLWYGRRAYAVGDLLKAGDNLLEVEVVTNLGNYMKSLKDNPVAQYWTNSQENNQPLQAMGMVGPVSIY